MFQTEILQVLIYGTVQGGIFALLAMGFSLVFGVGGILNQAHGAFYAIAGYLVYWIHDPVSLLMGTDSPKFYWAMVFSLIVVTIIGGLTYIGLIKAVQDHEINVVIITFALAFFFEQAVLMIFGALGHKIPSVSGNQIIFGLAIPWQHIIALIGSVIVIISVLLFINKVKIGNEIRAVAQDKEAAQLMGINVNRILMYTIMISAFLAGIAGILYIPTGEVAPQIGWSVLIRSFAIVVLGGLRSIPGSVVGSFILGYAGNFVGVFIGQNWAALVPTILIVVMLIVRPRGLFGKKEVS
ncbi:MAG: branched-chain amino acid ABC transporter permease [Candidatus Odinarchaeota archaeon]